MLIMYLYIHRAQKSKMRFGMDADLDGELTGMIYNYHLNFTMHINIIMYFKFLKAFACSSIHTL